MTRSISSINGKIFKFKLSCYSAVWRTICAHRRLPQQKFRGLLLTANPILNSSGS
jgi:hypothetical protein